MTTCYGPGTGPIILNNVAYLMDCTIHPSNVHHKNKNSKGELYVAHNAGYCICRLNVIGCKVVVWHLYLYDVDTVCMFVYQMWTVKEGLVHVLDRVMYF